MIAVAIDRRTTAGVLQTVQWHFHFIVEHSGYFVVIRCVVSYCMSAMLAADLSHSNVLYFLLLEWEEEEEKIDKLISFS